MECEQLHMPQFTDLGKRTQRVQIENALTSELEQDDSEIDDLLSSFYFDSSDSYYAEEVSSQVTIERLNPIYEQEEDEMFYDFYGTGHPSRSPPCSTLGSDDEKDSADADGDDKDSQKRSSSSSSSSSEISSPQSLGVSTVPDFELRSASYESFDWPVIEEDDCIVVDGDEHVIVKEEEAGEEAEPERESEWERRGRSRAVPARLARCVTAEENLKSGKKAPPPVQMHTNLEARKWREV